MKLIRISDSVADVIDGQGGQLQQFRRFGHAVVQQELLRGLPDRIFENPAEIGAVQSAESGNAFNGYIILKVLFYVIQRFFDIEVPHPAVRCHLHGRGGPDQEIDKQVQMSDQVEGGTVFMFGNVQHFINHVFAQIFERSVIHRIFRTQSGCFDGFSGTHSVKLDPDIFPWKPGVSNVCSDLFRKDHKTLSAVDLIFMILAFKIGSHETAGTGENIVKQIVVSGCRSERVGGRALFSPELVYAQIYEVFIWKYGKNRLIHRRHLAIV